ncbi:MAG: hypothetical protein CME86_21245, partial [Herbaspirillum sp.]|nr:hypothetical protein [Herbaspirillum sp.]
MSQERQWTDPVSLGSVNRDYDQGFSDGCSESKRLNEHLVAASAQGRAAGLEEAELIALLREIRPNYGDVGTRDVDVARQQKQIDR